MNTDPVYQDQIDGKWYFWDETWSDPLGPFKSEEEARRRLMWYCETVLKVQMRVEKNGN